MKKTKGDEKNRKQKKEENNEKRETSLLQKVAVDDESHIFVCDTNNSRVQVFSPEGKFVHLWGQVDEKGKRAAGPPPPAEAEEGDARPFKIQKTFSVFRVLQF